MIYSGCRAFTLEEALEHWGGNYCGDREVGDQYLAGIRWLQEKVFKEELATEARQFSEMTISEGGINWC